MHRFWLNRGPAPALCEEEDWEQDFLDSMEGTWTGLLRNLRGRGKNCNNSIHADTGLIGQKLSLCNRQFSNVTPLPSPTAEQVSLGNMQGFQQKEMLSSMQHTVAVTQKGQNTTFAWTSVAPG